MDTRENPQRILARRLRSLRHGHWSGVRLTQEMLGRALGGLSVPLISSWESERKPHIPPVSRLEAYATFFATERSIRGGEPRLLDIHELTPDELRRRDDLRRELLKLRAAALRGADPGEDAPAPVSAVGGPWHFPDGKPITLVCAELPADTVAGLPYNDPDDPGFAELYSYADLDALLELHGHIRAANPGSRVTYQAAQRLTADDYTSHLVLLGGVDWNEVTDDVLHRLDLPVQQVGDWDGDKGPYFEVNDDRRERHYPLLSGRSLIEDVALFSRGPNPFNRKRTISICNGMHSRGTYGVVRALTDERFRDRNAEYLANRFSGEESYALLTRVAVVNGVVLTPDWTKEESRLHEWPPVRHDRHRE